MKPTCKICEENGVKYSVSKIIIPMREVKTGEEFVLGSWDDSFGYLPAKDPDWVSSINRCSNGHELKNEKTD